MTNEFENEEYDMTDITSGPKEEPRIVTEWETVEFKEGDSIVLPDPLGRITFPKSGIYLVGPLGATYLAELPLPLPDEAQERD